MVDYFYYVLFQLLIFFLPGFVVKAFFVFQRRLSSAKGEVWGKGNQTDLDRQCFASVFRLDVVGECFWQAWGEGTPFLISVVFAQRAMRLYTDGNASWLVQTMDIEKEALWQTTLHLSLQQKQADFRSLLQQSQQDVGCSFGRQSLVRHANRCSICTVLGALRRKRPHT